MASEQVITYLYMRYIGVSTLPLITNLLITNFLGHPNRSKPSRTFWNLKCEPLNPTTWCFHQISGIQLPSSVILNSRSSCNGLGPSPLNSFSRKTISAEEPPWRLRSCWNIATLSARFSCLWKLLGFLVGGGI